MVDEFTLDNYKYYSSHNLPILNIVIDSIMNSEKSYEYLKFIQDAIAKVKLNLIILKKPFENKILITWIEGALNQDKTRLIGIESFDPSKP